MDKISFKPGTMLNPVPVVMVSCGTKPEERNIITVAWTGIVNSEPPMTYVSVRKSRHSHKLIADSGEFVINLCSEDLALATDFCGVKSGREVDKFRTQKLTAVNGEMVSCPMIGEAPVNLECKVTQVISLPSHDMFLAEIVKVHVRRELVSTSGKILLEEAGLICYNHGEYFGIKRKPLGRFGYSVMKNKTKKRLNKEASQSRRTGKEGKPSREKSSGRKQEPRTKNAERSPGSQKATPNKERKASMDRGHKTYKKK
ncbi:flavin reductase family protein [Aminipila butyrica]|uniref:Flavin reductase family protein n=1 Tax=Aminipila butyrica TaxID=433296 RepID=A0A858BV06_9FIRM|nr:flavin reductase family protein [Aminipila butyrica]QIB69019.1 flavin reductase family protein [Aminipila butyrica]